jgi:hypothetical protein
METLRKLLFALGFAALLFSCGEKGEEPQPLSSDSFISFKVNGQLIEFSAKNQPMGFSYLPDGPTYMATAMILGTPGEGSKNFISMTIRNESLFATGEDYEMQDPVLYQGAALVRILLSYADENGNLYNAVLFQQTLPGMKVTDDARFRFTKITDKQVEGNFDGVILGPFSQITGRGDTELIVTEGQFSLPLIDTTP